MSDDKIDPPVVPINVNGQMQLFSPGLSDAQVRELFEGLRLRGNRAGLFAEVSEPIEPPWP